MYILISDIVMIEFNIYINLQLDIFLDSRIHATVYLYSIVQEPIKDWIESA